MPPTETAAPEAETAERPAQFRRSGDSLPGYNDRIYWASDRGLQMIGVGMCLIAGAVAINGLLKSNGWQASKRRDWID